MNKISRTKRLAAGSALIMAGAGVGAAVSTTSSASAEGTTSTGSSTSSTGTAGKAAPDPTKPMRSDEKLLTGTTAARVRDLALAKYPGATIQRVETDSDGVYEAHIVTKAGALVTVKVGSDFTITGVQTGGPGRPGGARGGGDHDGDGPAMGGTPPTGAQPPAA
ncbi:MAG: hypothetical protein JWR52_2029 [Marmoricola sp.]|nr:hypothetical protein [Marmoricola sp.]